MPCLYDKNRYGRYGKINRTVEGVYKRLLMVLEEALRAFYILFLFYLFAYPEIVLHY